MEIRNLTPHAIILFGRDGGRTTIPASGQVARCASHRSVLDEDAGTLFHHVDIVEETLGDVEGLPAPQAETIYLVSALCLSRCAGRGDVFAPDTGAGAVRDDAGRIVGTRALVRAPYHRQSPCPRGVDTCGV